MNIKKNIPNTITLGNLFCGCLALIETFNGDLVWAAYFVGIALVLDFFDGFTARLLKVSSPIGKDLDSLADMVTFGVVPGMMMFHMIGLAMYKLVAKDLPDGESYATAAGWLDKLAYVGLIIPVFSCIRLAKFNNDTRQTDSFIGLPTPANAMVICSLALIFRINREFLFSEMAAPGVVIFNPWVLCALSVLMSLLLVAGLPLFALKFKSFGWKGNELRFGFLIVSVILLVALQFMAIPLVILLYILLSIVNNLLSKPKV